MALRAELIPLAGLGERQVGLWRQLAGGAVEPNPFFEPIFVMPSATTIGGDVSLLVAGEEGGPWLGCLPMHPVRRWRAVPVPAFASWVNLYCFLGTPLLLRGREQEALEAMLSAALAERRGSYLGLSLLGAGGPVGDALYAAAEAVGLKVIPYERAERAALRRRQDAAGYIALSSKHRRGFERTRRRLGEALGGEPITVDRAAEPGAVDTFLELEASGWKGREGTAFASIEGHDELLREVCRRFAEEGRLQLLSLECAGRVLAMACNLRAGSTIFWFKTAYDEEFGRYSPGIQVGIDNTANFHQRTDAEMLDSCAVPGNEMINTLWADRRPIEAVAIAGGARAALLWPLVRGVRALRDRRRT